MKNKFVIMIVICLSLLSCMNCIANAGESWSLGQSVPPKEITEVTPIAVNTLGVFQWIGYVVALFMVLWAGIRYITSSVGEKVKAKESLVPMLMGAVMIAGATAIATAVFNI